MSGLTLIVKTVTRLVIGFIVVYGASVVLYGHITPGGGFAGGVMLACALILIVLAFGKRKVFGIVSEKKLSGWDSLAALGIIEIVFIGLFGEMFFKDIFTHGQPMALVSGGTILWSNIIVGIKVAAFLFAVFMALAMFRMTREGSEGMK